jgi:prepilin signal peptidase PulO-like enzyme (type II secretory pathway)
MQFVDVSVAATGVLLAGLLVAAFVDWRTREVDDRLWLGIALIGGGLETVAVAPGGAVALVAWLVAAAFAIQHLLPWDEVVFGDASEAAGCVELGAYIGVGALLFFLGWKFGVGAEGVPAAAVAVYVSVLIARGLFESGLLYGGADAKALIVTAVAVPFNPTPWLAPHGPAAGILTLYPFAVTVLMNGAVAAVVIPIGLLVRNAIRGEWNGARTFTGYPLVIDELPNRFVWIADPTFHRDDSETAEDDQKQRERLRDELRDRGIATVWVTPQIPFVVLLAAGAILGVLFGNVVLDVFSYF